jgi:hypothetical protein
VFAGFNPRSIEPEAHRMNFMCNEKGRSAGFINDSASGSFTCRDCSSGKDVACEAVVNYREQATMKPMGLDRLARRVKAADEYFNKYEYFCFQYKKRYQQVL